MKTPEWQPQENSGPALSRLSSGSTPGPSLGVRLQPGRRCASPPAGSGRLGGAGRLGDPTRKTRFSRSKWGPGRNRAVTLLGASLIPLPGPTAAPTQPHRGRETPSGSWRGRVGALSRGPPTGCASGHTGTWPRVQALTPRSLGWGGTARPEQTIRRQEPQPPGSCLLPFPFYGPEKPSGAAVLRRRRAETKIWEAALLEKARGQASGPPPPSPAQALCAAPLGPRLGLGRSPVAASWPPPSHPIAGGHSLQMGPRAELRR